MSRPRQHAFTGEGIVPHVRYCPDTGHIFSSCHGVSERLDRPFSGGYRIVSAAGVRVLAHRLAWRLMTGEWPSDMVDHINGVRDDNRWINLRAADSSINAQNYTRAMRTNRTGLLGVCRDSSSKRKPFRSAIRVRGRYVSLGNYATAEEAHQAYLKAKAVLHPGCALSLEIDLCRR